MLSGLQSCGNTPTYSPDQLPPENSSFLERNFVCRFRCLLDNCSGFLVGAVFQGLLFGKRLIPELLAPFFFFFKSIPGSEFPGQTEVPPWSEWIAGQRDLQPSSAGTVQHRCACPPTTYLGNQGQNAAFSKQAQVGLHTHGHRQQVITIQNFLLYLFLANHFTF